MFFEAMTGQKLRSFHNWTRIEILPHRLDLKLLHNIHQGTFWTQATGSQVGKDTYRAPECIVPRRSRVAAAPLARPCGLEFLIANRYQKDIKKML